MTTCPQCGAELQATVSMYLTDVRIEDGSIVGFALDFEDDPEGPITWDEARVYCKNDHPVEWEHVDVDKLPRITLGGRLS